MTPLQIDVPLIETGTFGNKTILFASDSQLMIQGNQSNMTNTARLFKVGSYYVRFNFASYDAINNLTVYNNCQWSNNNYPSISTPTTLEVKSYYNQRQKVFGRKLCTIGDSISWAGFGGCFRNLLRDKGLQYDFIGEFIDTFGFEHSAISGQSTVDLLNRLNYIPTADSYHILLGTVDDGTAIEVHNNLMAIASYLKNRNSDAKINICSLLPRTDNSTKNTRNLAVNGLLSSSTYNFIDAASSLPIDWGSHLVDGLHPKLSGYEILTDIITSEII